MKVIFGILTDYLHNYEKINFLRHAKSSWEYNVEDYDRPLS